MSELRKLKEEDLPNIRVGDKLIYHQTYEEEPSFCTANVTVIEFEGPVFKVRIDKFISKSESFGGKEGDIIMTGYDRLLIETP